MKRERESARENIRQIERRKSQPRQVKLKPRRGRKQERRTKQLKNETVEREAITIHCSGLYLKSHLLFISP